MPQPAGPPPGYVLPPAGPPRKPHWWRDLGQGGQAVLIICAILVPVIAGVLIVATYANRAAAGSIKVDVTSCTLTTNQLAEVAFTAENTSGRAKTVRLRWEYRDGGGALVDTDSTSVTIPAGDTVRGEESTFLNAKVSSVRCSFAGAR
jgi:uncharacterized protein (TIGR02588 family)